MPPNLCRLTEGGQVEEQDRENDGQQLGEAVDVDGLLYDDSTPLLVKPKAEQGV